MALLAKQSGIFGTRCGMLLPSEDPVRAGPCQLCPSELESESEGLTMPANVALERSRRDNGSSCQRVCQRSPLKKPADPKTPFKDSLRQKLSEGEWRLPPSRKVKAWSIPHQMSARRNRQKVPREMPDHLGMSWLEVAFLKFPTPVVHRHSASLPPLERLRDRPCLKFPSSLNGCQHFRADQDSE
jgi:hypothetical protein